MVRLESPRLLFRDHEPRDLDAYCQIESDPIYRSPQPVHDLAELQRSFRESWLVPKSLGLLAAILKSTDTYIGRCGLYPLRDDSGKVVDGSANIAFYIARPYWGQGLATEAARAFVEYGFEVIGMRRIIAGINAENIASITVVRKLGFSLIQSGEGGGSKWHEFELRNPDHASAA
jgi:[ribosomal protein S5]-alanine N-acetyltransferase